MEVSRGQANRMKWLIMPAAVVVLAAAAAIPMARTSSMAYCTSCHEMSRYKAELQKSSHAMDKNKKPIECSQCHIPGGVGPRYLTVKTALGLRDLWEHTFGDPENLDRRSLQDVARRFLADDNCRACHPDLMKTAKDEPIPEIGRLSHQAYLGVNGNTKNGCAGCHFNMAHLPDFDRRYAFNAKFAQILPQGQEQQK